MSDAPSSATDICNLALDHCGDYSIEDIDDEGDIPELCARWYDQTRRALLRGYIWNFSPRYESLTREGDGDNDYEDRYAYPASCLRLHMIADALPVEDNKIEDYELTSDGSTQYINVDNGGDTLYVKYTIDVENVSLFDPLFLDLFALRLALKMVFKITKKQKDVERIAALLKVEGAKAVSVDGQERPPRRRQASKVINARYRGSSSNQTHRGNFDAS